MKFRRSGPGWQICITCGNEATELDPTVLRDVRRPARGSTPSPEGYRGRADRAIHRAPGTAAGHDVVRRVAVPRGGPPSATDVVSHPREHAAAPSRRIDRWTGADRLLLKHELQPDRLVRGRDDGGGDPGQADRGSGGSLRLDRQHLRVARGLRGPGRTSRSGAGTSRTGSHRQAGPDAGIRGQDLLVHGDFDACLRLVEDASGGWASTCSTRSIRSASSRRPSS
jgi:hypothetical protein